MKLNEQDIIILNAIKEKKRMLRQEIIDRTGIHPSTIAYRLDLLMAMGYVVRPSRGLYEITQEGKEYLWRKS